MDLNINDLLQQCIHASIDAGQAILEVYDTDFDVENKEDNSPLTEADKRAHNVIMQTLSKTDIPVLSEEGRMIDYKERSGWNHLWIVDPLDGTKEFVKRNGEFTVNIALVENGTPILGVIYVPVKNILYFGAVGIGSHKVNDCKQGVDLDTYINLAIKLPKPDNGSTYKVVGSRSHMSPETESFISELEAKHDKVEVVSMGSSLKICLVAEGEAQVYPRFAPTMEWDTAAGHAIAKYAGKTLLDCSTKQEMVYNREHLRNDWFIVQ